MDCERFRAAVSAQLDGEVLGMSPDALGGHLHGCPGCAAWSRDAERITRLARMDVAAVPDLSGEIIAGVVLPVGRVLRRRRWLRLALAAIGLVQAAIGCTGVVGASMGMQMATHATHEAAAWNLAIAAAFVAASIAPRRAAGLIPVLSTFLLVLTGLSVHDALDGAVTADRLATHLAALAGLILLIAIDRGERALPPDRAGRVAVSGDQDGDSTLWRVA